MDVQEVMMSDRRKIKIVITTISVGDNFETSEKNNECLSEIMDIITDDHVTLYRILMKCKHLLETIENE